MTTVRLAMISQRKGGMGMDNPDHKPALLVSNAYAPVFDRQRDKLHFRDWTMDSGAYTAMNAGTPARLGEYLEVCHRRLAEDPQLTEVFALDVIGDWRATIRNVEAMWEQGIPAIPTFHVGEPDHVLDHLAATYPKIAIGGAVRYGAKLAWAEQVFARVWPKPIHGLGFGSERFMQRLPFHSCDASNWEFRPLATGVWPGLGGKLSVRGSSQNLRSEVLYYLGIEERLRFRWRNEMAVLQQMLDEAGWPDPLGTRQLEG